MFIYSLLYKIKYIDLNLIMSKVDEIIGKKEKANELLKKGELLNAELAYKEILNEIEKMNEEERKDSKIQEQRKLILSNLAMTLQKENKIKESMECDKIIIKKIDPTFAKSYARLIDNNLRMDRFNMARYHYDLMKQHVSQDMISKFPEIIQKVEKEIEKHDEMAKGLLMLKDALK